MIDLSKQKFGRLIVIERVENYKWLCKCDCGIEKIIRGSSLKSGDTKSCGCLAKEQLIKRSTKHGHNKKGKQTKIYQSWRHMIERCTNSNYSEYQYYGGRGITVCERWLNFENFLEDMDEPPTQEHSIDRIDNDGNYCKSNCRWATKREQARNTRRNLLITFDGETQCLMWWAEKFNINYHTLYNRIYRNGWPIEKALTTPVQKRKQYECAVDKRTSNKPPDKKQSTKSTV